MIVTAILAGVSEGVLRVASGRRVGGEERAGLRLGDRRAARDGQADDEPSAALRPVGDDDPPVMKIDDRLGDREARGPSRPLAAPGARQKRSKTCGMSSGRMPGPLSSTSSIASRRSLRTRTRTWPPPGGAWRMALSTRITMSWRRRAWSPSTIAGSGSRASWTPRSAAALTSAPAPSAAMSPRSTGRRVRLIAPESDRASRSRSSTRAVRLADLGIDVVEGLAGGRAVGPVPPEMLDRAPDDGQRGPQLVARVGGELALAAERRALLDERLPDRDEGAAGIERPEPEGDEHDDDAAQEQHVADGIERLLLRGSILDHLDVDVADRARHAFGECPGRERADGRGPDVPGGRHAPRPASAVTGRPAGSGPRVRLLPSASTAIAIRPRRAAAEREPVLGSARPVARVAAGRR